MTQLASSQTLRLNAPSSNTSTAVRNGLRPYATRTFATPFTSQQRTTSLTSSPRFYQVVISSDFAISFCILRTPTERLNSPAVREYHLRGRLKVRHLSSRRLPPDRQDSPHGPPTPPSAAGHSRHRPPPPPRPAGDFLVLSSYMHRIL